MSDDDSPITRVEPRLANEVESEWLTTKEAAEYLRVTVGALRVMAHRGLIPYYKFARRNRFLRSELRNLILREKRMEGFLVNQGPLFFPGKKRRRKNKV